MLTWLHEHKAEPSESLVCSISQSGSHHCYDLSDGELREGINKINEFKIRADIKNNLGQTSTYKAPFLSPAE